MPHYLGPHFGAEFLLRASLLVSASPPRACAAPHISCWADKLVGLKVFRGDKGRMCYQVPNDWASEGNFTV